MGKFIERIDRKMSRKLKGVLGVLLFCAMCIPFANADAAGVQVANEAELVAALANGGEIELTDSITVTSPLSTDKETTIKGNGHSLTSTIEAGSGNRSIITALANATLTLENITLENSPKYGVQAYNGGKVILDKVTIQNCAHGAALINGGTLTIKDLTMVDNKAGIEFGVGENVTGEPALIMDGTIDTTAQVDAVYIDNAQVTKFVVENTETSANKVALDGDVVTINNADGTVVAKSNTIAEGSIVEIDGNEFTSAPKVEESTDNDQPNTDKKEEIKNPETADGIALYIVMAIAGIGAMAYGTRKLVKQN